MARSLWRSERRVGAELRSIYQPIEPALVTGLGRLFVIPSGLRRRVIYKHGVSGVLFRS